MKVLYESKDKIIIDVSDVFPCLKLEEQPKVLTIDKKELSLKVVKTDWRFVGKHEIEQVKKDKPRRLEWDDWLIMNNALMEIFGKEKN